MDVEVTLLQYYVVTALKKKPLEKEQIVKQLRNFNTHQVAQSIRYLVDGEKLETIGAKFKLKEGINYYVPPRLQKLIDNEEGLVPPIRVFVPDELQKFDILKLHNQGFTRTQIAKRLNMKKSQVIWTLCQYVDPSRAINFEDAVYVDHMQAKTYQILLKQISRAETIAQKLDITKLECEQILSELISMGAALKQRYKNEVSYLPIDMTLIANRKRGEQIADQNKTG
jgi:hypothetical protein